MRIVVTGAAGFIGSHLAERLAHAGHHVVGIDNFNDFYPRPLKEANAREVTRAGVDIRELDLATDDLAPALSGVEMIYHLAAQPGLSANTGFEDYLRNNVIATSRLLHASFTVPSLVCFVNASTSSVYGLEATEGEHVAPRPASYYGVTKLAAEQLVLALHRERGFPACSFRLFSVYGPRERPDKMWPRLIRAALDDSEFPLYEGSEHHRRSFTYVGDIVDGLMLAVTRTGDCLGEIFTLGTDADVTTGEGIKTVESVVGRPIRFVRLPPRPGDQLNTRADITKARKRLGYHPSTSLRAGVEAEVSWFRAGNGRH
jgi:nucleoside-diphosphate-sugar epimerase